MTLPREWGDGATDIRLHTIVNISYSEGRIDCRCGAVLIGSEPLMLATAWSDHGGSVFIGKGFENRRPAPPDTPDLARMQEAVDTIREMQARCTCPPGLIDHRFAGVMDCPNYQPGDELPEEGGDE